MRRRERTLLRRLSVFAGGFRAEAAEAVGTLDGLEHHPVVRLLGRLGAASLVTRRSAGGAARWWLPETVRLYAADRLAEAEEGSRVGARRAEWVAALALRFHADIRSPREAAALERVAEERENIRAALRWAAAAGEADVAQRIVGDLGWFYYWRAPREGLELTDLALGCGSATSWTHGQALLVQALLRTARGDHEEAAASTAAAVATLRPDEPGLAAALTYHALVCSLRGDLEGARGALHEGLAMYARSMVGTFSDPGSVIPGQLTLKALLSRLEGDPRAALGMLARALPVATEAGNAWTAAMALVVGAKASTDLGEAAPALAAVGEAVDLLDARRDVPGTLLALQTAASALCLDGRHAEAARVLGAIDATGARLGYRPQGMDARDAARTREAVRAALGGGRFSEAYAEGRAEDAETAARRLRTLVQR